MYAVMARIRKVTFRAGSLPGNDSLVIERGDVGWRLGLRDGPHVGFVAVEHVENADVAQPVGARNGHLHPDLRIEGHGLRRHGHLAEFQAGSYTRVPGQDCRPKGSLPQER